MGHLNLKALRLLSHLSDGIVLDSDPTKTCIPCIQAKAHRNPFPESKSRASRIGELVHSDVCYIGIPIILCEFTMFVLFVDDATRYMTIYLLRSKTDVLLLTMIQKCST